MKKAILISFGLAGLAIAACKKSDHDTKKAPTTRELLTAITWKYDTITLDLDKNGIPDSAVPDGYIKACDLDNTITFKSDSTGVNDEGPTKCDPDSPQTTNFTWSLSNGDSTLNIAGNADAQLNGALSIQKITDSSMVLLKNIKFTDVITIDANVVISLKK